MSSKLLPNVKRQNNKQQAVNAMQHL